MRTATKPKPIFRGLTIAAVGDLRRENGSDQWTDANITRWVTLREGRFVRLDPHAASLSAEVTHVICSEGEFRRGGLLVKRALQRGRACQIVTLDWLEDCMSAGRGKGKRLREEQYSFRRVLEEERRREKRRLEGIKGEEKGVKGVNTNLYRPYRDHTFFRYEVEMTREAGDQEERYVLSIFESYNAKPHLYWFVAEFYKKKGDTPKVYRPGKAPGVFSQEFGEFESFFKIKAGIPWAQRLVKAGKTEKSFFQYQPPTGGKPVGWVPAEFIPAEVPDVVMTDAVMTDGGVNAPTTAQSPTTAADTHAPVPPHEQEQPLITPAPSPRADLTIADPPSQDRAEKNDCSASARPSVAPPNFSWPTPPMEFECTDEAAFALLRDTAERIAWNTTTVG